MRSPQAAPRAVAAVALVAALLDVVAGCGGRSSAGAGATWPEGSVQGPWRVVYAGYGRVSATGDVITLAPATARSDDVTHAAMVVTTRSTEGVDATVAVRTVDQLRTPAPNPWEVAWVVWNHVDDTHFSYVALKPNGWEIGKEDPAYPGAQRYLATGTRPFALGTWHTVGVRQTGNRTTVTADGVELATTVDTERPYTTGALGFYTEDAVVEARVLPGP